MDLIGIGVIIFAICWGLNEKNKRELEKIELEKKYNIEINKID